MTKVLVREHNASEELDQLKKFLNIEAQKIVVLDEENPASGTLAEDDLPEITWYIHQGGEVPTSLYTVVITDDGTGAEGADLIVRRDEFSPSILLDSVRAKLEKQGEEPPLLQLTDGYITGTNESLKFVSGVAPARADDPAGILEIWRQRLQYDAQDAEPKGSEQEEQPGEDDKPAIPVVQTGLGW